MNKKIKKIIATAIISTTMFSGLAISSNLPNNKNQASAKYISSVNDLNYIETNKTTDDGKIGKIVETNNSNSTKNRLISNDEQKIKYINNNINNDTIRNIYTNNSEIYYLTESPKITLTSDQNGLNLSINLKFKNNYTQTNTIREYYPDNINYYPVNRQINYYPNRIINNENRIHTGYNPTNETQNNKKSIDNSNKTNINNDINSKTNLNNNINNRNNNVYYPKTIKNN